jgi:RNA polymerase sigma factor (sigma-70 family)
VRGDEGELYRALSARVLRLVDRQVRTSPENVEDACHFAWVAFLRHTDDLHRDSALAWLTTTAVHEAYKLIGREKRAASLDQALESGLDPPARATSNEPLDRAHQHEQLGLVRQLPERQQRIVLLQAAGLSHAEIAATTGDTERTVQRQLYRARSTLAVLANPSATPTGAATAPRISPSRGPTRTTRSL